MVSTVAGNGTSGSADGTGAAARFNGPYCVYADASGVLYVGDSYNHRVRKITAGGVVTTLAGNGTAGYADGALAGSLVNFPIGVTTDAAGNVYVADLSNNRVRKIQ